MRLVSNRYTEMHWIHQRLHQERRGEFSMTIKRLGTTLALVLASALIAAGAYASTVSYRLSTPGVV